ncbi:MAG: fold metallo-hydrolase [Candidatus Parcubacteria bacterium]|nr:fold metallo-hydrolase [Candidatus Parcubacteria bacterium]
MNIKKLKHCCMVIHTGEATIVTDPGVFSVEEHDKIQHADIILITHEHADHFHIESVKAMHKRIPGASIIANDTVAELLAKEGIEHHVMRHGDAVDVKGVHIEAFGEKHALMHRSIPQSSNVGFFIEKRFFYPGDAFTTPGGSVDVLALPVAGPWMKVAEAIDYALEVKPRIAFPVHDGMAGGSFAHVLCGKVLGQNGIEFMSIEDGGSINVK